VVLVDRQIAERWMDQLLIGRRYMSVMEQAKIIDNDTSVAIVFI